MKIAKVQKRLMFLSPTVQAGWEAQSYKSDFEKLTTLGQGAYGFVWKAKHKKSGAIYAIKEIKKSSLTSENLLNHVKTEVKVMYELNHPNIVKLYNHFEDDFSIYFVLEFAENGQLFDKLIKEPTKKFEEHRAAGYIRQVALALDYIHKKNIIHRDIKPQNILIGAHNEAKLADFGWSNFTQGKNKRTTYCGTLDYLAPEMVDAQHKHDHRVDIWSLGVLIYELCTGSSPFSSPLYQKNNLSEADIKNNIVTLNYSIPKELSDSCKDIISKILVIKPQDRLPMAKILSHPWIKQSVPEQPQLQLEQNQNWQAKLKHQFGAILQGKDDDLKQYKVFSKEQIYTNSRIESILNANKQKIQEQSDKKAKELQLKIQQLELKCKRQQEQLKYLRSIQVQHKQISVELTKTKELNRQNTKKIESMAMQMDQYQRIIQEYEKSGLR